MIHHCGSIGGAGVSLLHIVKSIDKNKYNVTVLCPDTPNEISNLLNLESCKVITMKKSPKIFAHYNGGISNALTLKTLKNILGILSDVGRIKKYIREINPDIVAVNSMTLFWIGKVVKKLKKNSVCFHRETYQKGLFGIRTRFIKYGLSRWFDEVVFISWNDYYETGEIKANKRVIYDRVDTLEFTAYKREEARKALNLCLNKKYILYLGGLSELKGPHVIMKAMKYVQHQDTVLIFISNLDSMNINNFKKSNNICRKLKYIFKRDIKLKILNIYFKNNLEEKVIFRKTTSEVGLYYRACDLVVFPSIKPHQARPIYEAGLTKIPILIADFKETKEFAKNEFTALTFRSKDSYDLAKKIDRILDEDIDIYNIINNNYKQSVINHNIESLKDDLNELFD